MRKASSKIIFHFRSHTKSPPSVLAENLIRQVSSLSTTATATATAAASGGGATMNEQNPKHPPSAHLKSCSKTQGLLFSTNAHSFSSNPSQDLSNPVNKPSQISSRQRKIKEKSKLEEEFDSAKSADEMVKVFKDMEASFNEKELGLASLKIGLRLDHEGEDPQKVLDYATKALKVLDTDDDKLSLPLAMSLQLSGSACFSLSRFNDSLAYLNRANRILGKLEEEGSCKDVDLKHILHAVHLDLANTKNALGRREDALGNLRKCLELKEATLGKDSRELGKSYRDMAEAYVALLNFKDALPYCMKAMEIHKAQLGNNSVEVAHDRRLLGVIYTGLEEHGKALEQNQMSQKVLKNWGLNSDLLRAEIDAANMQIALGKYDEAISTLKGVVQQTDKEGEDRALIFISMAKALCNQENFPDSKRCLELACGILNKKESTSPLQVAEAYMEISMQYESMNEFETAISLLKRAQAMLEKIPQEQHSVGSVTARIGWLLLLTGRVKEAVPYLEDAAERLKESFGTKHYGVGYVYQNLGAAYLEIDRPQSAAQMFAIAKEIMDVSLGPHHQDSIVACENLSKAYAAMESYMLAIEFQEKVVDAWRGHGPSAQDEFREAQRVLEKLKVKSLCDDPDKYPSPPGTDDDVSTQRLLPDVSRSQKLSRSS